jgi:hypothetical protein
MFLVVTLTYFSGCSVYELETASFCIYIVFTISNKSLPFA